MVFGTPLELPKSMTKQQRHINGNQNIDSGTLKHVLDTSVRFSLQSLFGVLQSPPALSQLWPWKHKIGLKTRQQSTTN